MLSKIQIEALPMESYGEYTVRGEKFTFKNFSLISNPFDAYFMGYMACDGSFIVNRGFPFMAVSSTEEHIINGFRDYWVPGRTIYNLGLKCSEKVKAINNVFEVRFPSRLSKEFAKYGVFCKKEERRVVGISDINFIPYMAGCIDADGFIGITHRKDCRTPRLRFFITHRSELFLSDIQNRLLKFGIPTGIRQHGEKNCFRLSAQNTGLNMSFLDQVSKYILNRKKLKMCIDYLDEYYAPQKSDELLESESQSAAKSTKGWKVQRLM